MVVSAGKPVGMFFMLFREHSAYFITPSLPHWQTCGHARIEVDRYTRSKAKTLSCLQHGATSKAISFSALSEIWSRSCKYRLIDTTLQAPYKYLLTHASSLLFRKPVHAGWRSVIRKYKGNHVWGFRSGNAVQTIDTPCSQNTKTSISNIIPLQTNKTKTKVLELLHIECRTACLQLPR